MKSPITKAIVFLLGLALLYPIKAIYLLNGNKYKKIVNGMEVYYSIDNSKRKNRKIKTLIIGDSVAHQFFRNYQYNDSICSLACNQGITLAGQYCLINNFIQANPSVEKIVLIYTPFAFNKDLNQKYTFQYFLKPFYNDEYKPMFSSTVTEQVKKIPFYYASQFPPVLTSNLTPDWEGNSNDSIKYFMSQVNEEYLAKIIELCNSKSVKFLILPTPTKISSSPAINEFSKKLVYANYSFKDYFSKIRYLPDTSFIDEVHLKHPIQFVNSYIEEIKNM